MPKAKISDNAPITEIHLLDYLNLIVRSRWMIVKNVSIVIAAVVVLSFVLPRKYTAVTTLMPPAEKDAMSMNNLLSEVNVPGLALPGATPSSAEILIEMLKSRSVGERVLQRSFPCKNESLPLIKILKYSSLERGLLALKRKISFSHSKQGIITIVVQMGDRNLAAEVANAFAQELDHVNQAKSVSRAKNSRIYLESQLRETEIKLAEATRKLAAFQLNHKAVSLEEQMKVSIEQAGELKGEVIAKRAQLRTMLMTMKEANPLVIKATKELEELQREYENLQYGSGSITALDQSKSEFYLPFVQVPEIGVQLAELLREVKVQETVWELLNQQYYQAKIDEARDTPTVQVLDEAVPPEIYSWPNRKVLVIVCGLLAIVLSIFYAFAREYWKRLDHSPDEKRRVTAIVAEFQNDWRFLKKKIHR
jgi:tyrosine-protein kinase Etk/Wzc